jgi:hypothetical protein
MHIIMVIASNQGFTAGIPHKNVFAGKAQMSEVQRLYCAYITKMDGYAQVYYVYIPVVGKCETVRCETVQTKHFETTRGKTCKAVRAGKNKQI